LNRLAQGVEIETGIVVMNVLVFFSY
jgi:hypothetical protein